MSINSTDPSNIFGGTWEQIKDDAYLKIVTDKGGELGGTSKDHKIPVSSMPAHRHRLTYANPGSGGAIYMPYGATVAQVTGGDNRAMSIEGEGQPYYPYYYGIYMWVRTA